MVLVDFEKDYYAILGLENTATRDEIKRVYRGLVKQYHPDVNRAPNATEIFNAITEAYEVLSDPKLRAEYDAGSAHGYKGKSAAPGGGARERGAGKARRASPVDVRLERTLLLSLIVPGIFHIAGREKKLGTLLLAGYITFWALAIVYSVEIGVLAVLVWAIAILDAYGTFRKTSIAGQKPES
jgi:curved DNA-binding protein CbpA